MMFIETKIDDLLINSVKIFNTGRHDKQGNYKYHVQYLRVQPPLDFGFYIFHKRDEGAEKLVFLVYQEIDKRLREVFGKVKSK